MKGVFANRNGQSDFVGDEIRGRAEGQKDVYIASAFFTEAEVVEELLAKGCNVFMVVRLGFPTSPTAIEKVRMHPNLQLRIYTGHSFHPKLYIFGDDIALVGSANLTSAALLTNQEVVVSVESSDDRFRELVSIFEGYWDEAEVLTDAQLSTYKSIFKEIDKLDNQADFLGRKVLELLGETAPSNITRGKPKVSKQTLFLSTFRKTYQESVAAFNIVRKAYKATGYRKASEEDIPLRLEIDSFISFVREKIASNESWKSGPLRSVLEQEREVAKHVETWSKVRWPYFEDTIVGETYPRFKRVFHSRESIMAANDSDLFDALATLHSFGDRYRFFEGGMPTWKAQFPTFNDPTRTRETLAYLVHGQGDLVERMANAIYHRDYKLAEFGQANVQELIGWRNREELPIINSRTTKVLRFFGSEVRQL